MLTPHPVSPSGTEKSLPAGSGSLVYQSESQGSSAPLPEIRWSGAEGTGGTGGIEIPDCLVANVERHCAHLRSLLSTLGKAGIDEATIEASISQIVRSYEVELLHNIKNLHKEAINA